MEIKNKLKTYIDKIRPYINSRNVTFAIAGIAAGLLLAFVIFSFKSSQESSNYAVLYTNLSPQDAGAILEKLQQWNVPYKVAGEGSIILVPRDIVYQIRLKLAAEHLPGGKTVGFEIFDNPKFGMTEFEQNVNYLRALEGELARTIESIEAVQSAKVLIAIPKESIFVREHPKPTASVLLRLKPGADLTPEQIKAIMYLVAHAVPNLTWDRVTVADNRGRLLSELVKQELQKYSKQELEVKSKLELELANKVKSLLIQAFGPEHIQVAASVEVEVGKENITESLVNPDLTAIVSQRKIQEKEDSIKKTPLASPGTDTNVPPTSLPNFEVTQSKKSKKDTTTNFDVSKVLRKVEKPIFKIKRLTVSVLIDKNLVKDKKQIELIQKLVEDAVGYNPQRGDKVTVAAIPFGYITQLKQMLEARPVSFWERYNYAILSLVLGILLAGMILGYFLYKRKRYIEMLEAEKRKLEEEIRKREEEELAKAQGALAPEEEQYKELTEQLIDLANESPEVVATVIRKWMKEDITIAKK